MTPTLPIFTLLRTSRSPRSAALSLAFATLFAVAAFPPSAPAQTLIVLYAFNGDTEGKQPNGLVRDSAGNLYGTNSWGGDLNCGNGAGCGTVFKLDTAGTLTVLHTFTGGADGVLPLGTLLLDSAGNLYGTTQQGGNINCYLGTMGCGTVYKLDAAGNKTTLYAFPGSLDGALPYGSLVQDTNGNLYCTTAWGGVATCNECGTVFKVRATGGTDTVLHKFTGRGDGILVYAGVIRDAAGNLYGTTYYGGAYNLGTVFKVDTAGKESVLHSFNSGGDGETPAAALVADGAYLYGTTQGGGTYSIGTAFKMDKSGNETVLHSFGAPTDGRQPQGALVHDAAGNLYGTTYSGGAFGYGTVFKMDTTGKETILHSFGVGEGSGPNSGVIRDAVGNLYGTTYVGGAHNSGTIFKLTP